MITPELLIAADYRKFQNTLSHGTWNTFLFQKRVRDDKGTRYFIDIVQYDWGGYPQRTGEPFTYEATVRFYTGDGETHSHMTCMDDNTRNSIEGIEEFFNSIWIKLELGYYEFN